LAITISSPGDRRAEIRHLRVGQKLPFQSASYFTELHAKINELDREDKELLHRAAELRCEMYNIESSAISNGDEWHSLERKLVKVEARRSSIDEEIKNLLF
jgi:chromosome segregation ATPase